MIKFMIYIISRSPKMPTETNIPKISRPLYINKRTVVLFIIGIIILILLLFLIGIDKVLNAMSKLDVRILLFLIGLEVFIIFLHTLRWAIVLYNKIKNKEISFTSLFLATSVGLFSGNIVPAGNVINEPIRAYILSKLDNFPMAKSFGSAIINLNLEILPVLLLISIALYFVLADEISVYIVLLLIIAAIVVGILSLVSFLSIVDRKRALNIATFIINLFSRFSFLKKRMSGTKTKIKRIVSEFHDGAKYGLNLKIFGLGTIISFIIWFSSFLRQYIVFIAIGYNIDIAVFVAVVVIVLMISYIPTLPGGIGIREASSIGLYTLLGVPSEYAAAAVIVDRLISYWFVCLFGYAALIIAYKRINNKNII